MSAATSPIRRWNRRYVLIVGGFVLAFAAVVTISAMRLFGSGSPPPPLEVRPPDPELLLSLSAWDAATHDERLAAARSIEEAAPEFALSGLRVYEFEARRHEVAVFTNARLGGVEFVLVPGGSFQKVHTVDELARVPGKTTVFEVPVPQPFLLARSEARWALWNIATGEDHDRPGSLAYDLSASEAKRLCHRARLDVPTARQWEYACRAGRPEGVESIRDIPDATLDPVNAMGLARMWTGVREWCWNDLSTTGNPSDPLVLEESGERVPMVTKGSSPWRNCGATVGGVDTGLLVRLEAGDRYVGVRPARQLLVIEE